MSQGTHHTSVVVGIDGSAGSKAALAWAVEDARIRALPLRIVSVFAWALRSPWETKFNVRPVEIDRLRTKVDRLVAHEVDAVRAVNPDLSVSGEAIEGASVDTLVDESEHASVLVLGSRHLNAVGSAVLGSVSAAVAARAKGPVVVVRGSDDPVDGGAVVVGIDGDHDEVLLGYGFDYASRHQVPLRAVLCWRPTLDLAPGSTPVPDEARRWLSEAMAGWQEKYPDVTVFSDVIREHAVSGLVATSTGQRLLVVGARGERGLSDVLLGSVSQGVLHHAKCPVAVISRHA